MSNNKPIYIFVMILAVIVSIAAWLIVAQYNNNKPIVPDKYIEELSLKDMVKIKKTYEQEGKKEEFLELCESIELAVVNKFLDGSVTNDAQLSQAIYRINGVLESNDWSYLGLVEPEYWMGKWSLDDKGAVEFTFQDEDIKPDWIQDEDVKEYIK